MAALGPADQNIADQSSPSRDLVSSRPGEHDALIQRLGVIHLRRLESHQCRYGGLERSGYFDVQALEARLDHLSVKRIIDADHIAIQLLPRQDVSVKSSQAGVILRQTLGHIG